MPPSKKKPEAAAEAAAEAGTPEPIKVQWRGQTFTFPRTLILDARFRFAAASMDPAAVAYEALGPMQAGQFLATLKRGEDDTTVLDDFIRELMDAAGWGNSTASR